MHTYWLLKQVGLIIPLGFRELIYVGLLWEFLWEISKQFNRTKVYNKRVCGVAVAGYECIRR
jgi:hypothetical protein